MKKENTQPKTTRLDYYEVEELAAYICGIDYDEENDTNKIDEELITKFKIDIVELQTLLEHLVPMIEIGKSPATEVLYKGFSKKDKFNIDKWIIKQQIKK